MQVIKRNGQLEPVSFDKVLIRLQDLCTPSGEFADLSPLKNVSCAEIAKDTIAGITDKVTTKQLDNLAVNIAVHRAYEHPEYDTFAARIFMSNYHKDTIYNLEKHFSCKVTALFKYTCRALYENYINGIQTPLIAPHIYAIVCKWGDIIEKEINYSHDYHYDYLGCQMLYDFYLQKSHINGLHMQIERPQHMLMRVALGLHCSEPYKNFDKMRYNNSAILSKIQNNIGKYLSPSTQESIIAKIRESCIEWKDVITLLSNHGAPAEKLDEIAQIIAEHTLSWNDLLAKFDVQEPDWNAVFETYRLMRDGYFTHATPTLYNSGTCIPQLSSCFLMQLSYDSLDAITDWWKNMSQISKWAGGIGSHVHNIRPELSYIRGTNGKSNGFKPLLKVVNEISLYIDQGGNKRPGSHAIYIEPWCGDIEKILDLKLPRGNDCDRARSLFYALWVPDEFMRAIEHEAATGEICWYLMDPSKSPRLDDVYDAKLVTTYIDNANPREFAFTHLYRKYIREGKFIKRISAVSLWNQICNTIAECGIPYICFKDAANRKSNQKNLGTIKSSNLCTEIMEYSAPDEIAVCNLASICLSKFIIAGPLAVPPAVKTARDMEFEVSLAYKYQLILPNCPRISQLAYFDWAKFEQVIRVAVRNLNKVIDINAYPLDEAKYSNLRHRPIAIGEQGLADLFTKLRIPYDSDEADKLSFYIHEFMYYISLDESCELARTYQEEPCHRQDKIAQIKSRMGSDDGINICNMIDLDKAKQKCAGAYQSFAGSPLAQGKFQFELWVEEQLGENRDPIKYRLSCDWETLRKKISNYGVRNSQLIALMPTASTSSIMGNSPCFEPHNAIIYKRRNLAGEFTVINKDFINDMIDLGLWNQSLRNSVLQDKHGSVQSAYGLDSQLKEVYKIAWNINQHKLIDMSLTRDPFIDQASSLNWFIPQVTPRILTKLHFYGWRRGKKTSSYYTRQLPRVDAQKIQLVEDRAFPFLFESNKNTKCTIGPDGRLSCCDA